MGEAGRLDEQQRILQYWWLLELFAPQEVPKPTPRSNPLADEQVIAWSCTGSDATLPWQSLPEPTPRNGKPRVWRHTVYLGVYQLESTYQHLHARFVDDPDAYHEGPEQASACAGLLVDADGHLITGSTVLSTALWAVSRIQQLGPEESGWAVGFDLAQATFVGTVDNYLGDRRDREAAARRPPAPTAGTAEAVVLDGEALRELLSRAHSAAGVTGLAGLATDQVVIRSRAVPADSTTEVDNDFLNSFYLDDLALVRSRVAQHGTDGALAAYLTGDASLSADRVDVTQAVDLVDAGVAMDRLPAGRWPSVPEQALALSQQFAVNLALHDLADRPGLIGVNGPPGTGKTTMLRDILAGNLVERARRLAALANPWDAFTAAEPLCWKREQYHRRVRQLRPEFTGFEMVVASANNAAVENISHEIPARQAISEPWRDSADYFADIATAAFADRDRTGTEASRQAWGLVAGRLGNKRNRTWFGGRFWHGRDQSGMQAWLQQFRKGELPAPDWSQSRAAFSRAEQRVAALVEDRRQAAQRLRELHELIRRERELGDQLAQLRGDHEQVGRELVRHRPVEELADAEQALAARQYERQLATRPGFLEVLFSFGRALRPWRAGLVPLAAALEAAERLQREAEAHGRRLLDRAEQLATASRRTELELSTVRGQRLQADAAGQRDRQRFGGAYPAEEWVGDRRELQAPWLDAELDQARSELFLAALQLHQDFLANVAGIMEEGLRAAVDVIRGDAPRDLEPEKRWAAWQLFFLAVPLISTTFASVGRMFGDIGAASIGWLLIDEAGQASPQCAVGAIWRANRVVAVGDPLQLPPVVTVPDKVRRDIAATYGLSSTWIPPRASVQTLADRVSRFGTTLRQAEEEVWVGAPLRVHRRCDEPMFGLCNRIAYNGLMVHGVHRRLDDPDRPDRFDSPAGPLIQPSSWLDEPAPTPGTHLQPNQIARLRSLLDDLAAHHVPAADVIAISPFRVVANELRGLIQYYPGLRAGTIHTAQGREAPVVVLVLGGDREKPGAKAWAAATVNLVNVAASRAQRRLYVIGERSAWAQFNYFGQLSEALQ